MKRPLSLLALGLSACSQAPSPAPPSVATARPVALNASDSKGQATSASTRLAIYSGGYELLAAARDPQPGDDTPGYALVDSELRYALKAGNNVIALSDLPRAIDVAAVALRPVGSGIAIDGQRFLASPVNAAAVLAAAVGRRIAVEHTSGGAKQTDNGVLVAAGDSLTLALPDGRTKVIGDYDNFSLLDVDPQAVTKPTLRWQVSAQRAGDATFKLSYPTGGLAWRAEYRATLAKGADCRLSLDGAALVANRSGVAYADVALTLVAGEPQRVRETDTATTLDRIVVTGSRADGGNFMPQPRVSAEYYAYPLRLRATLADAAIERVPLFAQVPAIACERTYVTAPALDPWQPPQPLLEPGFNPDTGPQPVMATVSFDNTRQAGLGQPLPAGRVRVFDGGDFLGESPLPHRAQGATLDLQVGTAFDLSAERKRSAFRVDRAGRSLTESFVLTLKNAKPDDATIRVVEPLPRWSDWEIVTSSVPATKRDAQHAQFDVRVPAGGQAQLAYSVRYRWAADLRP